MKLRQFGKYLAAIGLVGAVALAAGCGKKVDKGAAGEGGAKKVVNVAFTNYYVPYDFVNDNTLTVYIKRLREKIEDNSADPKYILTVRGMGYKWNGSENNVSI